MNDLSSSSGDPGLEAFAALLRERIPGYGVKRGALQAFADRINGQISSSELGRYARGEIRPTTFQRLDLLARAMGLPVDYCRAVLEGREAGPPPLSTDDVVRLIDVQEKMALLMEEAQNIARRLTMLHEQSARSDDPTRRRPKKGVGVRAWMDRIVGVSFQGAN